MGGKNEAKWNKGIWDEYELIDGNNPGDVVGVRPNNDPNQRIFTPVDMMALECPDVNGNGTNGTKGACMVSY